MNTTALSASTITGDKVRNNEGDKLGNLEEIVIDIGTGRVAYAVLASGGFLGLGDKYFAVPWDLLSIDTDNHEVVIDVDKEVLKDAPGFDKDDWPDVDDRTWMGDVYRYYGSEPYWEEGQAVEEWDEAETAEHLDEAETEEITP
ncbi:MAG TPA: PRC-barrel domain-containing protein [Acidimicrobiia bacterium]|nr:PRC-barrel domain-containing protein [Acidimicrobiia bacterium]